MGLERNWVLLVLPEPGEHSPTKRQNQQHYQFAKTLSVAEVGRLKVKTSGFGCSKQRLNAPSESVIGQCALRAVASNKNQQFTILEASGNDVDTTALHPTHARENPLLAGC